MPDLGEDGHRVPGPEATRRNRGQRHHRRRRLSLAGSEFTDTALSGWIEALATTTALAAAIVAASYAAGAFTLESERENRWQRTQELAQVSLTAAWGRIAVRKVTHLQTDELTARAVRAEVKIRNGSELPIYDTTVQTLGRLSFANNHLHLPLWPEEDFDPVIPPQTTLTVKMRVARISRQEYLDTELSESPKIEVWLRFRDSSGIVWLRTPYGDLERDSPLYGPWPQPRPGEKPPDNDVR